MLKSPAIQVPLKVRVLLCVFSPDRQRPEPQVEPIGAGRGFGPEHRGEFLLTGREGPEVLTSDTRR